MANPEHLAELEKGVESWNEWRFDRFRSLNLTFDLDLTDLSGAELVGADLREANLSGANLSKANLSRARLIGADLIGANLLEARLIGADLSSANLREVDLRGANLHEANLNTANLGEADLSMANLSIANLRSAHCRNVHLRKANLREADLSEANLYGADLSEANLYGANLYGAHLSEANLYGADLSRADLSEAKLSEAKLGKVNLSGANLSRVDLSEAKLSKANLGKANLYGANLSGANLNKADLYGAHLEAANLSGANLSEAASAYTVWARINLLETVGLSTLHHASASSVGTDTLVLSKGRLPVEFLKGCGLADWEIEGAKLHDPNLTTSEITDIQYRIYDLLARGPIQLSPIFISYSHGDTTFVDNLGDMLDKKGVRYWRDIKDATAGRLDKVIERGISLNPTVLLVLSERAIESDWVEFEVDKAVQLSKKLKRDVLCPIALDKTWLESDRMSGNLRAQIKKYNVLDFSTHTDDKIFAGQFRKLIDGLGLHYRDI